MCGRPLITLRVLEFEISAKPLKVAKGVALVSWSYDRMRMCRHVPSPIRVISTQRFLARPSGVSFEAIGLASPKPWADNRFGFTPCDLK